MKTISKSERQLKKLSKFLKDGEVLLQFALAAVIETVRGNPNKYNNLLVNNASASPTSTPLQDLILSHIEDYKDTILDESKRLYDRLVKQFANNIMNNAVGVSSFTSSLSSTFPNLSNQRDMYRMDNSESFRQNKNNISD